MKLLAASLTASLLSLGIVLAPSSGADPIRRPEPRPGAAGVAHEARAQLRVWSNVAVSKPRRHGKRRHPGKAPPPKVVPAPASAPVPPPGQLIFASTFDGSFQPWYNVQSLAARATISTAHPFAGSGAGRFEVQPGDVEPQTGDARSEVSGPDFSEGQDIYVRDEIRVPNGNTFGSAWELINQLHEDDWGGSPGIATFLDPNRQIRFGAGDGNPRYWQGPQLEPERWYTLVYRVYLSQDPNQGFVEVWFDGVQQVLLNGSTRMYGETIQTSHAYLKAGIYRSESSTGVSLIEHDNIVVGTSYGIVMSF